MSQCRAGEKAGSVGQVTGVAAVLQYGAHRERASVGFCQISGPVLHHRGPYTTLKGGKQIQLKAEFTTKKHIQALSIKALKRTFQLFALIADTCQLIYLYLAM